MAGAGIRLFVSGEVAYAADVNSYLMDQVIAVFENAAARDSAFGTGTPISSGGDGKPALSAGRFCYLLSTNQIQYYNGTSWVTPSTLDIAEGSITEEKLGALAVTVGKIADNTITNAKINSSAGIASTKLGPVTVTAYSAMSAAYANNIITVSTNTTISLPHNDTTYPIGTVITFVALGASTIITFQSDGTSTVLSPISGAFRSRAQNSIVTAIKISSQTWLLAGDLQV